MTGLVARWLLAAAGGAMAPCRRLVAAVRARLHHRIRTSSVGPVESSRDPNDRLPGDRHLRDVQLDLGCQLQEARLALADRERALGHAQHALAYLRQSEPARIEEAARARIAPLISSLAGPLALLGTQLQLSARPGSDVGARDLLAVGRQLADALQHQGLTILGAVGDEVSFEPDAHDVLGDGPAPLPGQPVTVRIAGASYQGQVMRKMAVEFERRAGEK